MRDVAGVGGPGEPLLEHEHVEALGRLGLDEALASKHLDRAEHISVEAERAVDVAHLERDVRQPASSDHAATPKFIKTVSDTDSVNPDSCQERNFHLATSGRGRRKRQVRNRAPQPCDAGV